MGKRGYGLSPEEGRERCARTTKPHTTMAEGSTNAGDGSAQLSAAEEMAAAAAAGGAAGAEAAAPKIFIVRTHPRSAPRDSLLARPRFRVNVGPDPS